MIANNKYNLVQRLASRELLKNPATHLKRRINGLNTTVEASGARGKVN